MKQRTRTFFVLLCIAAMAVFVSPANAQNFYGTVAGTVSDSSGAPMEGAAVSATNIGTGVRQSVQTSNSGEFRIVNLVPGNYKIDVPSESPKINEADERGGADDYDLGRKLLGDNMQLRKIFHLLIR